MNKEESVLVNKAMGKRIQEIRIEKGKEIEALAARAGMGAFAWKKIEAGAVHVTYDTLIGICVALGVHPKEFMDFDYLGAAMGILDKAIGGPSGEGLRRFFEALDARARVSRSLREELVGSVSMLHLSKPSADQAGEPLFFVLDGVMMMVQVTDESPLGFITTGNFFFDLGRLSIDGPIRYSLRPLMDTILYVVSGEAVLGMLERQKTLRVLLSKIWEETIAMGALRKQLLGMKGRARIAAMYGRYPGWMDAVPPESVAQFAHMGSSFYYLDKKYKEELRGLPGSDEKER